MWSSTVKTVEGESLRWLYHTCQPHNEVTSQQTHCCYWMTTAESINKNINFKQAYADGRREQSKTRSGTICSTHNNSWTWAVSHCAVRLSETTVATPQTRISLAPVLRYCYISSTALERWSSSRSSFPHKHVASPSFKKQLFKVGGCYELLQNILGKNNSLWRLNCL